MLGIFLAGGVLTPLPSDLTLNTAAAQKKHRKGMYAVRQQKRYIFP